MNYPSSSLSPRQLAVLRSVQLFGQLTISQLRRIHYVGTEQGIRVRSQRHTARLVKLGMLTRIWCVYPETGAMQGMFQVPGSTRRSADMHTLDIGELYARLVLSEKIGKLRYLPETHAYKSVGHIILKPDAYVDLELAAGSGREHFIEVDRGTEGQAQLKTKLARYVAAYESWDLEHHGPVFPPVVWTVRDRERKTVLERLIKRSGEPALFVVVLFDEAVDWMTK